MPPILIIRIKQAINTQRPLSRKSIPNLVGRVARNNGTLDINPSIQLHRHIYTNTALYYIVTMCLITTIRDKIKPE